MWMPAAFAAVALFGCDAGTVVSDVDRRPANVKVGAELATEAQIASLANCIAARYRVAPLDAREYERYAGRQSDTEQRCARSVIAEGGRLRRALRSAHAGEADAA